MTPAREKAVLRMLDYLARAELDRLSRDKQVAQAHTGWGLASDCDMNADLVNEIMKDVLAPEPI